MGSHLIAPILTNELGGHVRREHVLQEQPSQVLHCLCLLLLLPQLLQRLLELLLEETHQVKQGQVSNCLSAKTWKEWGRDYADLRRCQP